MEAEAGVLCQPRLYVGMFVGGVVVQDQVDLEVVRDLTVDDLEEGQELGVAVLG